ncbi:hypothetical protein ACFX15_007565 [Malus domestica]
MKTKINLIDLLTGSDSSHLAINLKVLTPKFPTSSNQNSERQIQITQHKKLENQQLLQENMGEDEKKRGVSSDPHHHYPPPPPEYGTFQGVANYPPPPPPYHPPPTGFPQPVPPPGAGGPSAPHPDYYTHGYQTVPGYAVAEGRPVRERRLPCCGCGLGWCLFIIGFVLATVPWYVGAFILLCARIDPREKPGYIACTLGAILATVAIVLGATKGSHDW